MPRAEMNFRMALDLSPNQPLILNYLGYSLVEKNKKLEEARKMIEKAVAARPNSGFIIDSLGWSLFTLGKFEDAIQPMERAVELMPDDPIDHWRQYMPVHSCSLQDKIHAHLVDRCAQHLLLLLLLLLMMTNIYLMLILVYLMANG